MCTDRLLPVALLPVALLPVALLLLGFLLLGQEAQAQLYTTRYLTKEIGLSRRSYARVPLNPTDTFLQGRLTSWELDVAARKIFFAMGEEAGDVPYFVGPFLGAGVGLGQGRREESAETFGLFGYSAEVGLEGWWYFDEDGSKLFHALAGYRLQTELAGDTEDDLANTLPIYTLWYLRGEGRKGVLGLSAGIGTKGYRMLRASVVPGSFALSVFVERFEHSTGRTHIREEIVGFSIGSKY